MKFKIIIVILGIFTLTSCNVIFSNEKENNTEKKPESDPTINLPDGNQSPPVEVKFEHFVVIREFASQDTGALFGFKPSVGTAEITELFGPEILNGHIKSSGILTPEGFAQLFTKGENPMPTADRDSLTKHFTGYNYLYFENYDGELCAGEDSFQSIVVKTKTSVGGSFKLTFRFDAVPQLDGNCKFHIVGLMQQNF